jgi:hypothetical protein
MSGVLEKGTLSIPEASARIGIAARTGRRLHQNNQFPVRVLKIGGRWKVLTSELDRYLGADHPGVSFPGPEGAEFLERQIRRLRLEADELERWLKRTTTEH